MPNSKTHSNSGNKARHLKRQRCDMILSSRRREGGYLCLRISTNGRLTRRMESWVN